ncbi:hypothetical protein Htur_5028 (plasmid) [Haloterrigena turkmenica DSM 5511]|uniref:Uncharacterized protein n=1 Tax=Haloterrigena turkmenica (strain ATCC 51198 / DSM 5511 / JCM 9101 / NCIMB 13204 / VKM B-1734 / 4k) TaxID=543526 RepID=D2S3G9_HALTV|nr:hypothetical protein [Haloterrigena turkmenica]ADB63916.1 hypothetical protein Htur_5028 [Haloterrigena turkmenica DSM 5511]
MPDLRRAGGYLASAAKAVALAPVALARFAGRQASGTYRNVRGFFGWLSIDNALPPAVASTLRWLGETVPKALGLGSSYEQTAAAGVLIIGAITATILTFGLTAAIVVAAVPFLLIGFVRFVPLANGYWKAGRSKIRDRDGVSKPKWDR